MVEKKHDIMAWLESHRQEIEVGKLVVFLLDECHLLWGDVCGYVWGKTNQRIEVPIVSDRQRQTYFGALNYSSKQFVVKAYGTANSEKRPRAESGRRHLVASQTLDSGMLPSVQIV